MHPVHNYIDRVIETNGFICNDHESDGQFWTGYRIFIRDHLDDYATVEDWNSDTGGWNDRGTGRYNINGCEHENVTEYVLQRFGRGCDVVIDAGYKNTDLGFAPSTDDTTDTSLTLFLEKNHLLLMDNDSVLSIVNLHRRRNDLEEIPSSMYGLPECPHVCTHTDEDDCPDDCGTNCDCDDAILNGEFYLEDFLDTTSRTAKIEALRVKINELEYNAKENVDQYVLTKNV